MHRNGIVGPVAQGLLVREHIEILERRCLLYCEFRIQNGLAQRSRECPEMLASFPEIRAGTFRDVDADHFTDPHLHLVTPVHVATETQHARHVRQQTDKTTCVA